VIDAQDIVERAGELSLDSTVVEKDYVLGWLLAGISQHPEIGPSWVFKGHHHDQVFPPSYAAGLSFEGALTRASDRREEEQLRGAR
jgi:hypothetical protein